MVYIIKKRFKETSRRTIEEIKKQQHKHQRDIIQPRDSDGELNPNYVKSHGARNLNISQHDIKRIARKGGIKMERYLTETFKRQQKQNGNQDK